MLIVVLTTILSTAPVSDLINKCSICFQSSNPFIFSCSAFHLFHEKFLCANHAVINPLFILCTVFCMWQLRLSFTFDGSSCSLYFFFFYFPRCQRASYLLRTATAVELMGYHIGSHSEPHFPGCFSLFMLLVASTVKDHCLSPLILQAKDWWPFFLKKLKIIY